MSIKKTLDILSVLWYNSTRIQPDNSREERLKRSLLLATPYNSCKQYDIVGLSIGVLTIASWLIDAPTGLTLAGFLGGLFASKPALESAYNPNSPQFQDTQRLQQAAVFSANQANQAGAGMGQGMGAQSDVLQQLMMQAQGQGPNPAQQALANATGQNVGNQFAMAASGAGGAMNPALAQRQAAMTGAGIQQDAAGQSALMQAQQQLAAQQAAGALGGQMIGQAQQGRQIANQAAGMGAQHASQDIQQFNAGKTGMYGAQVGSGTQTGGALLGGIGTALSSGLGLAHGGEVPGKAMKPGDSEENDIVPVLLSPGEIVIPRSHASDPKAAAAFAHAVAMFGNKPKKD
jgi:hypothetical protein